jgi:hypothetical protein
LVVVVVVVVWWERRRRLPLACLGWPWFVVRGGVLLVEDAEGICNLAAGEEDNNTVRHVGMVGVDIYRGMGDVLGDGGSGQCEVELTSGLIRDTKEERIEGLYCL